MYLLLILLLIAPSHKALCSEDSYLESNNYNPKWGLRRRLQEQRRAELQSAATAEAARDSTCPPGCLENGVCNEELGRCDCPRHWTGPDCRTVAPNIAAVCARYGFTLSTCRTASPCFNSCHGRGRCVAGFCHCEPGFWGMDCSLSMGPDGRPQLLAGQGYTPRATGVKIYVYDLPPNMTSWFNVRRLDRPLNLLFWQRLQSAGAITANGEEADYYFIPLNSRSLISHELAEWALPYIRRAWPWWGRDGGHRHLVIHTGDLGIHEYPKALRRRMAGTFANLTWLTHWGLHTPHAGAKWEQATRPGKDIVIPVMITSPGFQLSPLNPTAAAEAARRGKALERKGLFFFAGRVCGDRKPPTNGLCGPKRPDYSAGVRQRVFYHHHNRTGFKVVLGTKTYMQDLSSHVFCLAPTGGGHGKRQVLVALMGCIPVPITDGVHQPFEPELDWAAFSHSVPEADIPHLPEILAGVPGEQLEAMQSRLRCAAQHLFYSSSLGAIVGEDGRYDAFETILEILRMRRDYPDVPPERYREVDERFRKFADCDLGGPDPALLCTQGAARTHPAQPTCAECHRAVAARRSGGPFFAAAGGAACCSEMEVANCTRIWA